MGSTDERRKVPFFSGKTLWLGGESSRRRAAGAAAGKVMRLEHVALWTEDLERLANFYSAYFGAIAGPKYINQSKGFESRFLSFESGARLELMKSSILEPVKHTRGAQRMGLTHLAVSVDSVHRVNELTSRLKHDGFEVLDGPRLTGDGYYESVILDPDGNRIEITA